MSIQTPILKIILTRLMLFVAAAVLANVCMYWLPKRIAGFIYRSHLPTAAQKTFAWTQHDDHSRS
ncbi:MAG: hypothetical protein PHH59_03180 [Methylovulum sp.]|uniref:hypothetical protein n=1 Tax=Methylovulum sp. TaxID=1916980 RepID=UPI00262CFC9D|nr:hypothetical protein [Methylovulum sp.]MDD2723010.1 hypothetical protein [Methylovulum sp.]MDD5125220.1 hypothetical protein [Methylovulum sp.]